MPAELIYRGPWPDAKLGPWVYVPAAGELVGLELFGTPAEELTRLARPDVSVELQEGARGAHLFRLPGDTAAIRGDAKSTPHGWSMELVLVHPHHNMDARYPPVLSIRGVELTDLSVVMVWRHVTMGGR